MSDWGFTVEEYQLVVGEISNTKHLIVEGKTDKCFLKILLNEFSLLTNENLSEGMIIDLDQIDIDELDTLIIKYDDFKSFTIHQSGNRKRIESIHNSVKGTPKYNNLIFFVDREFDMFTIDPDKIIQDQLNKHKVDNSLIWSRGHSIENYLFDITILHQPLRRLTDIDIFDDVITMFNQLLPFTIRLASTVSITLKECGKIENLKKSIQPDLIDVNTSEIRLRIDDWEKRIPSKIKEKSPYKETAIIIKTYKKWDKKIQSDNVDINILRWLCHGHIGISIIWNVYLNCIRYCCTKNALEQGEDFNIYYKNIIKKTQKFAIEDVTEDFANWWANKAVRNECLYPAELLQKLKQHK